MIKKIIAICLIISLFLVIGCKQEAEKEDIKTEEQAQEAVVDVSEDISDIADTLESINEDLG
ncbi:MAG: hypothetical protein ABH840_04000 [Nanoarchaeota archaeon]